MCIYFRRTRKDRNMAEDIRVLGLCGSLRAASYNGFALEAAAQAMPAGMAMHRGAFARIPIYDADEQAAAWPDQVLALGEQVRAADAVLIASPEYNFSVPGGLKNALDWLSRLPNHPFRGKPVAIMGAATGPVGTARMQYDLRKILHFLEASVLLKPEVFIAGAQAKFDAQGALVDEATGKFISDQMRALRDWILRCRTLDGLDAPTGR